MGSQKDIPVAFGKMAEIYEKSSAGSHRLIARKLMSLSPPFNHSSRVLDNATGTGFVVEELQRHISSTLPSSDIKIPVVATDAAPTMIQYLDAKIARMKAAGEMPNLDPLKTYAVRAEDLDATIIPDNTLTHSYMSFGVFFCTDPISAASNIYRSLAPGGTALITTFHDLDFFVPLRETYKAQCPSEPTVNLPFSADWQDRGFVEDLLMHAGFEKAKIQVFKEDTYMRFTSVEAMAISNTDLFTGMFKRIKGWEPPNARDEFKTRLVEALPQYANFQDEGEDGVTTKMLVNVWICTK